ncbi:hypothetical protein ACS0TY_002098 [Phlomoides rotata]
MAKNECLFGFPDLFLFAIGRCKPFIRFVDPISFEEELQGTGINYGIMGDVHFQFRKLTDIKGASDVLEWKP